MIFLLDKMFDKIYMYVSVCTCTFICICVYTNVFRYIIHLKHCVTFLNAANRFSFDDTNMREIMCTDFTHRERSVYKYLHTGTQFINTENKDKKC